MHSEGSWAAKGRRKLQRGQKKGRGDKGGGGGGRGGGHKGGRGGGHKGGRGGGHKNNCRQERIIQPAEKPHFKEISVCSSVEENSHVYQSPATTHLEPPHLPCRGVQDLGANGLCLPHSAESKQCEEHAGIEEEFHLQQ